MNPYLSLSPFLPDSDLRYVETENVVTALPFRWHSSEHSDS